MVKKSFATYLCIKVIYRSIIISGSSTYILGIEAIRKDKENNDLPNARKISQTIIGTDRHPSSKVSTFLTAFGQFLDHDLTKTPTFTTDFGGVLNCCKQVSFRVKSHHACIFKLLTYDLKTFHTFWKSFLGFPRLLFKPFRGFPGLSKFFQGFSRVFMAFWDFPRHFRSVQSFFFKAFQNSSRLFKAFQGFSRLFIAFRDF